MDGAGQGRAFLRVGTRAKLVQKDQAVAVSAFEDADDVAHVRGEGAEALLDALLIADVREDVLEDDGPRAVVYGEVETRLGHEGKQANGLEGDSFPARVRPGDDQHAEAVAQFDRDGHHCFLYVLGGVVPVTAVGSLAGRHRHNRLRQ